MSSTEVYHYARRHLRATREPRLIQIDNGFAFAQYVLQSSGVNLTEFNSKPKPLGTTAAVQRVYNDLIESDAPKWQKTVATFMSQGTLIYDEDRQEVASALRIAEGKLELPFSQLTGLALVVEALPRGLISVNGNSINGCCLGYEDGGEWVWLSQRELKQTFLRAAVPTRWTYADSS